MSSFADDLAAFNEKLARVSKDVFANATSAVKDSITEGSAITGSPGQPVDTGYMKLSWQAGFNEMPAFPLDGTGPKKDPAWTGGAVATPPPAVPAGDIVTSYIVTNTQYAEYQEDGTGPPKVSTVGGHHSVKLTHAGFQRLLDVVVAEMGR
jgi:hypothetical protein